ncbi:MAG: hypothetical protein IJK39_00110 [Bacteroidales bacterium]|nr:hypothetical protein [Bacteroidales bacterium]
MKTQQKESYESPYARVLVVEVQTFVCQSMTEITEEDPDEEIGWDEI